MVKPDGYTIRFPKEDGPPGEHGSVAFKEKHWKIFTTEILMKARAQVEATMKAWCKFGPSDFPPQKFKFEKHYEKGGKSVRVEVFKARHVRFYGAATNVNGKAMFLVTAVDTSKKDNKADPAILEAAGKAAHELIYPARQKK